MFYPECEGEALTKYREMVGNLFTMAQKELNVSKGELVLRPLRSDDIGPTNDGSTQDYYYGQTAVTWDTVINATTINDNRFIGVNGFYMGGTIADGPSVPIAQLRFTAKGSKVAYWNVAPVGNFEGKAGYSDEPIIVGQNMTFTLENWGRTASSISDWGLIGAVVERRGLLINP